MTEDQRRKVRGAWGAVLTFMRQWIAIFMGVFFAIAGTHARMLHDAVLTVWDVALCFLAVCCVFGIRGLELYREVKLPPRAPPE